MGSFGPRASTRMQAARVAFLLVVGLVVACHGSMEQEGAIFELGESGGLEAQAADVSGDEDPSMAKFDVNAEDQEDRIGVADDGFDEDDSVDEPEKEASDDGDMASEVKAIQGTDDTTDPDMIGESGDDEPQSEKVEGAANSAEKVQKTSERTGKQIDKATEKRTKSSEVKTKEFAARAAAQKKKEGADKEATQKKIAQGEEEAEKEKVKAKTDADATAEEKKKSEEKQKLLNQKLSDARKEAEKDAKSESSEEAKEKAGEKKDKTDKVNEEKTKKAAKEKMEAADKKERDDRINAYEKETKDAKKEQEKKAQAKQDEDEKALELEKSAIKEKGDKAYNRELTLEAKQKSEIEKGMVKKEKGHKKTEKSKKASLVAENESKVQEVRVKADQLQMQLSEAAKKANVAADKAVKYAEAEKTAKLHTHELAEDKIRRSTKLAAAQRSAESAAKNAAKAFTAKNKEDMTNEEKIAKSKLSEVQSKVKTEDDKYDQALVSRERSGKDARTVAESAARAAVDHLNMLRDARHMAKEKLEEARKARAEVDYLHAKITIRDGREGFVKSSAKEADAKAAVVQSDKQMDKVRATKKKNDELAKEDADAATAEKEREEKFATRGFESVEKSVQLAKQRVAKWLQQDDAIEQKVIKLKAWKGKQAEVATEAAANELNAKKLVDSQQGLFEAADKKRAELSEKEDMNRQFSEMLRKDDEKERQEQAKKIEDKDRTDRMEERKEKRTEANAKAEEKEKETAEKTGVQLAEKTTKDVQASREKKER